MIRIIMEQSKRYLHTTTYHTISMHVLVRNTHGNAEHVHLMDSGVYVVDVGRSQHGMWVLVYTSV